MKRLGTVPAPSPPEPSATDIRLLTLEEAASICRSSYGVVYKAVRAKKLPSGRAGRRIVVSREDLFEWVRSSEGQLQDPPATEVGGKV